MATTSKKKSFPAKNPKDKLYIEFDEEDTNSWGVFGDISGHCYATFSDKDEAIENYPNAEVVE